MVQKTMKTAGYEYYCTNCGQKLTQSVVLFDMMSLLVGEEAEKKITQFKFYLTQEELCGLYDSGTPANGSYHNCSLTFGQFVKYLANERNMNRKEILKWTPEKIQSWLSQGDGPEFGDEMDLDLGDEADGEDGEQAQEDYTELFVDQGKLDNVADRQLVEGAIKEDLGKIQQAFWGKKAIEFGISLLYEQDDMDNRILTGYYLKTNQVLSIQARVCPYCNARVFDYAGTAEHQSVAFIGYQSSSKTSTVLALTDYAQSAIKGALGNQIWAHSEPIEGVRDITLVEKNERLQNDLKLYREGIAPRKTEANARIAAYSATFRVKSNNKYHLFTLFDLPGELCLGCDPNRPEVPVEIDKGKVLNTFQIAMSVDAYIVCFDTSALSDEGGAKGVEPTRMVNAVCTWADEFQKLRMNEQHTESCAPMMVLFTKCKELESGENRAVEAKRFVDPIQQVYMFHSEKQEIDQHEIYRFAMRNFNDVGELSKAYHAVLRTSPYGYAAPSEMQAADGTKEAHLPKPINIDRLMRWILSVTGCIPTQATYRAFEGSGAPYKLRKDFCIERVQLRHEEPLSNDEALARCALFENPGAQDRYYVENHNESALNRKISIMFGKVPKNNAEEE